MPATIAVCIEVASPERISGWLDAGWMPNLARIRDDGFFAPMESITELSSGSIWPTFYTGVQPAKHGQFFTHMQLEPGSYRIVKKYADDVPVDPFWLHLHRHERSSIVLDVAQSRPTPGFRGVHVTGWGSEFPAWPQSSEPPGVIDDILARHGPHPLTDEYRLAITPETSEEHASFRKELVEGARHKGAITRELMQAHPHDFVLTVFPEPHWATHLLWDTLDPEHPRHDPAHAESRTGTFRAVLGAIDEFLGETRAAAPDANFLVFSLSGSGPNYSGWHVLPQFLQRIGMAPEARGVNQLLPMGRWGAWTTRAAERLASRSLVETLRRTLPRKLWDRWTRRILHAGGAWPQSRVFWVPNDYSGSLRVNLKGREPEGRVAPGAEYEAVCEEVTRELLALRHLHTGRPIVRDVLRPQTHWQGPEVSTLPDLLVLWANEHMIDGARSERVGTIDCPYPERRTGAHRRECFVAGAGPAIALGAAPEKAHMLDLAPTFLRLAGVPVPEELDGRVWDEVLRRP